MTARGRKLAPDEAALWKRVIESVRPLQPAPRPAPVEVAAAKAPPRSVAIAPEPFKPAAKAPVSRSETLDGGWDRRLARGLVAPESTVDLHGHSLAAAHARLDYGLEHAIARGDRVLLLVTGKPPVAESKRPHARGAIRAAVGDWLAISRHADRIAAVRGAHPRHGGAGALYIILRRTRSADSRIS